MIIVDTLLSALLQLSANKLRTSLTMLGIIIGVGAVIALMAAGQGAQQGVTSQVAGLGSNLVFVQPGETEQGGGGPIRFAATTLTSDDADAIEESELLPYVDAAISQFDLPLETQLLGNGRNTSGSITATEPEFPYARSWDVAVGRFITSDDIRRKATNVVLGWTVDAREWEQTFLAALTSSYVVQERVDVQRQAFPVLLESVHFLDLAVDHDPYLFWGRARGNLCRLSSSALLNVTAGDGSVVPTYLVEGRA